MKSLFDGAMDGGGNGDGSRASPPEASSSAAAPVRPTGIPPGVPPELFASSMQHAGDDEEGEPASPEEQRQYDQIVVKAGDFMYSEKGMDALLAQMNDPHVEVYQALAKAAEQIVDTISRQAKASKVQLSPDAMYAAAADFIVPELLEIGQRAKIFPAVEDEQTLMGQALYEAQKIHAERMPEEDRTALSQQAGDFLAKQVAREADRGELPQAFQQQVAAQKEGPRHVV